MFSAKPVAKFTRDVQKTPSTEMKQYFAPLSLQLIEKARTCNENIPSKVTLYS